MRFGLRRGVTLAIALVSTSWIGSISSAKADLCHRTIPAETPALDYRTGQQMMAPAIPGGCYTKDYCGTLQDAIGVIPGTASSLLAKARGLCHLCGGKGCRTCFGKGLCHNCGGQGCGLCGGGRGKIFGHGLGSGHGKIMTVSQGACGVSGCGIGGKHAHGGPGAGAACGLNGQGCGTSYAGVGKNLPAPQVITGSGQAFVGPGMGGAGNLCGINGCGGHDGVVDPACGGKGCGLCGGLGKLFGHCGVQKAGLSDPCGNCGGRGCGFCHGSGLLDKAKGLCRACGGKGCALCGRALGIFGKLCHKGEIKYFVGAGGPVPLTPGYVPWVNPLRAPRDFFAFPPFSETLNP